MKTRFFSPRLSALLLLVTAGTPLAALANVAGSNSFAGAQTLPGTYGYALTTDLYVCNAEASEPSHLPGDAAGSAGKTAWWKWTAPDNGYRSITTRQNALLDNTFAKYVTLAVYEGDTLGSLVQVAANFQHFDSDFDSVYSLVSFRAVKGTTYRFAVDGAFSGAITDTTRKVLIDYGLIPLKRASYATSLTTLYSGGQLGMLTVELTNQGSFTGKLSLGASSLPFKGALRGDGRAEMTLPVKGGPPHILSFSPPGFYKLMLGTGGNSSGSLYQKAVFSKAVTHAYAGRYNCLLQKDLATSSGFLTATISASGTANVVGQSYDGTPVTFSSALYLTSPADYAVFGYRSLFGGAGGIAWDGEFDTNFQGPVLVASGTYKRPPAKPGVALYPDGLITAIYISGQIYQKPVPGGRVNGYLDGTEGVADFFVTNAPGEMPGNVLESVTLSEKNKFTFLFPFIKKPALTISPATGLVSGSFAYDATQKKRTVKGILYKLNGEYNVAGYATGSTQMLRFRLEP